MKKIFSICIFLIFSISIFSINLGEKFLPEDIYFYYNSYSYSLMDIKDENLNKIKAELLKYENFNEINLFNILKDREHFISFAKFNEKDCFFISVYMTPADYRKLNLGENLKFESDYIQGNKTYFFNDYEKSLIYSNYEGITYISNNFDFYNKVMSIKTYSNEAVLSENEIYNKLAYKDSFFTYKYYYKSLEKIFKNKKELRAYYSYKIDGLKTNKYLFYEKLNLENTKIDLSKMIPSEYDKLSLSLDGKFFFKQLKSELELMDSKIFDDTKLNLLNKIEYSILIAYKDKLTYILKAEDFDFITNEILKAYDKAYFFKSSLSMKADGDIIYFELPVINIKKYFYKWNDYVIISESPLYINELKNSYYENPDFKEFISSIDFYYDKKNKMKIETSLEEDNLLIEKEKKLEE